MNYYYGGSSSKYNSKKVKTEDGYVDSKKEARRLKELKLLESAGKISNLQRQVPYVIIPRVLDENGKILCDNQGKRIGMETKYIADFVYEKDGQTIVEDVKGYQGGVPFTLFNIKRKLMFQLYGIIVRVV